MSVQVRLLEADEWPLWRDLRIRATHDSPDAFRDTLDHEVAHPDSHWEDIIRATVEHPRGTLLIAVSDDEAVGILFGRIDADETRADVGAMWVDPRARGVGVGGALLDTAIVWASDYGASRLVLWVTDGNTAAERLYASRGLTRTGATDVLRENSTLTITEMGREIDTHSTSKD
jgi:GNAT superfamily N-acetyltransferase